jgi:hypothetical protein
MLVQAIDCERKLRLLEKSPHKSTQYKDLLQALLQRLGSLNSVANVHGKGRNDFSADVILRALEDQASPSLQSHSLAKETAQHLCIEVLDSLGSMRQYLQDVSECLECVDPHLCKNEGLVTRLADFEQSYELGRLYMKDAETMRSLCLWVSNVQRAKSLSSDFSAMCESFDAELFLVLPRIIWLCFLAEPSLHTTALRAFLPEKFASGAEFAAFRSCYLALGRTMDDLLTLAVRGPSSADGACGEFLLQLERWSIELQRNHSSDWNQCSEVMVRCLSGSLRKHRDQEFAV